MGTPDMLITTLFINKAHRFDGAPINIAFARGTHIVMHDRCLYKTLVRFSLDQ